MDLTSRHFLAVLIFLVTACAPVGTAPHPSATPMRTAKSTRPPTTFTPTPSRTPRPTATLTYEQAFQPYTIAGLRARAYKPGTIENLGEVDRTPDYTSYLIRYPSDGLTIYGLMQVPTQGKPPYPVIVMNHGFFSRTVYVSGDGTDRAAEYLNKRGYLTIAPDYRSWGQSDSGPSIYYSGLAIDVVNLLQSLDSLPEADVSRVGLWGHSMGGGVTMKVLTILGGRVAPSSNEGHTETTVRAAVLYSTVSADQSDVLARWGLGCFGDVLAGEIQAGCNSSDVVPLDLPTSILNAYASSANDPAMLERVSPIYYLRYVDVPVQIHFGVRDGEEYSGTPPAWSQKLYQAFLDAKKPAKLFGYDDQKHSFIGDAWFDFMAEVARFFDENVKNAP